MSEQPPVRSSLCQDCPFRRSSGQRDSMIRTMMVADSPGEWWPCHIDDPEGWGLMGCAGRKAAELAQSRQEAERG